jgi:MFS transporter, PAT family, beta-lactamase induction signal transducer AmpG
MLPLSESRALRLSTLTAMYFAQGVPWGFMSIGYGVLLADLGLGAGEIGAAMGLAYLPWSFKILWGPMLDAVPQLRIGRRRPFIVFAELMMGLSLLGLLFVDPTQNMAAVTAILFVNNTFAALQDVAVDALAIDIVPEAERDRATSFMWASKSLGVAVGGGGGLLVAKAYGWNTLFVGMAVLLWLIMLFPLLLRERQPQPTDEGLSPKLLKLLIFLLPFTAVGAAMYGMGLLEERLGDHWSAALVSVAQPFVAVTGALAAWPLVDRPGFAAMRRSFSTPTPWWAVLSAIMMPAGYAMVGPAMVKLIRVDLALSEERIAFLSAAVDPAAGVIGALFGGFLADRIGVNKAIGGCMGLIAVVLASWAATSENWDLFNWLVVWTALFGLFVNAYSAATFGLYMAVSNPKVGATHFAIYMAATNLTYAWTAPLGGIIADRWGFPVLFGCASVLQFIAIVLLLPINPASAKAHFALIADDNQG